MHALASLNLLLALAAATPQRAPTPEESRLFEQGMRAFAAGDGRAAERAWQAGYALGHDPAFLVHIGEAEEKAGAPAEAAQSYRRYLREASEASDRADIEARVARLAPPAPAAPIAPSVTPAAAPTGPAAPPPEPTGEFGGVAPAAPSAAAAAAPPGAQPATPGSSAHVDAEGPPASPAAEDSGWNRYSVTAMVATGVTVALLGTAGFFGASASSHENDADRLVYYRDPATGAPLPYSSVAGQYTSALADGRSDAHAARIALVGAAGTAVVAAIFFVLDARGGQEATVSLAPAGNGLGAVSAWRWRF